MSEMIGQTPQSIISEIKEKIAEPVNVSRALTRGKLHFFSVGKEEAELRYSPITWVLRAQAGSLDKIRTLFTREGEYGAYELVAIARNLMENLIWLKLFNENDQYGLIFYSQLLDQQRQNNERIRDKINSEIDIFAATDAEETRSRELVLEQFKASSRTEADLLAANARNNTEQARIDMNVRRQFCIYAGPARFNTYIYQIQILRERELPRIEAALNVIVREQSHFSSRKSVLLPPSMLRELDRKWNWSQRAQQVGMSAVYNFLYGYTSKLLHSTPLNLITEKALNYSEMNITLDYIYVAICDILDEIEKYHFEGEVRVALIDVTENENQLQDDQ